MYNTREALVQNRLSRHAITSRHHLTVGRDGALTIYIQHESPGRARESNWLPAPRDHFILSMRLYWPGPEILEDVWTPPAIERI
jgi:DNA sulfur modification protein DndE